MNLDDELQKIYDSEINVRISWLWDGGIDVWLGDDMNGYLAQETVASVVDIAPWLQEAIAHFYPTSTYAAGLSGNVKERAATRLFLPPKTGISAICPHCGAAYTSMMYELMAFICSRCGNLVQVEPPKVQ